MDTNYIYIVDKLIIEDRIGHAYGYSARDRGLFCWKREHRLQQRKQRERNKMIYDLF